MDGNNPQAWEAALIYAWLSRESPCWANTHTRRDQHGTNKRYGIFSAVNWTLMYDVEHHRYATEFPSNAQVFHFKPESRPLTMKQEPGILDYNCPVVLPFDLPEDMPTPEEVKFK